jgi:hypothetical protein
MTLDRLHQPVGPHLHLVVADESRLDDETRALERSAPGRTAARIVRGAKGRTRAAMFDEFAAALQFPYYFGENWHAFEDCLSDLEWLGADGYVVVISHAVQLLAEERPEEFALFVEIVGKVAHHWSQSIAPDGRTPQVPRAFHLAFHAVAADEAALSQRLLTAGAVFDVLTLA